MGLNTRKNNTPMEYEKKQITAFKLAACAFFFMQGIIFSTWSNRIADIRTVLAFSEADLGVILLGLPIGQLLTMPLSGYLVSRFSSKKCIYLGTALYPTCLLLIDAAQNKWQLFASLICFGISANINNISVNTQGVSVEKINGRSSMGMFHGTWSLACVFGGFITMGLINLGIGITAHFLIVIAYAFVNLAVFGRMLLANDTPRNAGNSADVGKTRGFFSPTPFILMLGATAFGSMSCEGTMFDWSVIYFRDVVRVPTEISSIGYICFMSMMATGRFSSDYFVNKYGPIRVLQFNGITIMAGMMTAVLFPYPITAAVGFFLVGIGVSSVVPICYSSAGKSKRIPAGVAIATVSSIGFIGFLMGPPLIGFIAHALSLRVSFATMAFVGLFVSIIAPFMRYRLGGDGSSNGAQGK